ncbi:MAG: hypothetical protein II695_11160 [Oscillospiraceae bacterium]|nr:hypothetical protein [Oscillospiraceae bacterium]
MTGTYRFADKRVRIDSIYPDVHALCRRYAVQGDADIDIRIVHDDILNEISDSCTSEGYAETLAVYRKIAEIMPYYDIFLFHGSAIAVDNECYIFAAPSGTGKSTHARLWREVLGDRAVMVNDDKPLIRIDNGCCYAYGTPYDGKHRLSNDICVPIRAVCIIQRDTHNHICETGFSEAFPFLMAQSYRPRDAAALGRTISLIERMKESVRFYRLGANMEHSAAELSYETMRK